MREPLGALLADGFPVLGTCAGLILLAREVLDGRPDQRSFGAIDCSVRRNGYGRQRDSFEAALDVRGLGGGPFPGVFIRAPRVEAVGPAVEVLAEHDDVPVLMRSDNVWVSSFHPGALRRSPNPPTVRQRGDPAMSGHSKWHSIKHAKGAADAARGKAFARLARQIEVAARDGGGDVEANPTLRSMIQKARDASMPKDNIERAIKRGTGELEGVTYETINYEGYATNGVAVFVEVLTDNRNRTGADIKNIFTRNGGSLAEPGAVAWQFERKGVIILDKSAATEDDLMLAALDAGAEDIEDQGDTWQITTGAYRSALGAHRARRGGDRGDERRPHDAAVADRPARRGVACQVGAARHRRARGARRRAERLRQLRHPRRRPARGLRLMSSIRSRPIAALHGPTGVHPRAPPRGHGHAPLPTARRRCRSSPRTSTTRAASS